MSLGHILLGLAASESEATQLLHEAGVTAERIASLLASEVSPPRIGLEDPLPFAEASKAALVDAVRLATRAEGLGAVRSVHLLMALTASDAPEIVAMTNRLGIVDKY